ncbi:MAG: glycerophosphodiester phosphodiesterase family protein [Acidimicrobiales bacterium]|nr:glycerophosphodiester phosphodiesterase family protein [Acidimicrobiales bacterium]
MPTRLPPLLDRAILFAHRGARANEREHTREAFELALRLGATGLQADVWLTADDRVVLDRRGLARRFSRRTIRETAAADLADRLEIHELLEVAGDVPVRLRIGDGEREAVGAVMTAARAAGVDDRLWLAHDDLEVLSEWRDIAPEVHLINSTSLAKLPFGAESRAAELAAARVDAIALAESDWTGGMVTLFHRFDVLAFADGAHYERQLARVIDMGVDAVSGDHADRMAAVAATFD